MPIDDQIPETQETISGEELGDEELSLEQLSQAYAKVLKDRKCESTPESETAVSPDNGASESADALLEYAARQSSISRGNKRKALQEIDAEDNASCPISPESILEAILFVGAPKDVKLTERTIAAVMRDISPKEIKQMAAALNKKYEKENTAYRVVVESGNYSLELADDLLPLQNHFYGRDRAAKLSQGAIDVLAVVAYNQPVTKEQVDRIRARSSGALLTQLARRNLLDVERTSTKPVKRLYTTTDRFLDLFGLEDLDDLPQTSSVSDLEELAD